MPTLETALVILAGIALGSGLALLVGLALRRRRRSSGAAPAPPGPRPSVLGTPAQRTRALWMAVGIAALAMGTALSGADAWAGPLLLLAILLAGQSALFSLIERVRAGRR
ncbi:MAG: hypothetical protein QOK40_3626 [Miltoncostaeaceae bacterium]|jgi:hypothetical protein|nr:hypothetical protein [Miltoncostaeaceae bacterium]